VNPAERAAWERIERRERERVALHEAAHGVVAARLGARDIDMSVNREQGWAGVCVADLPQDPRTQVTYALAGYVAARAHVGATVRVSELVDILELERRDDLARAVERDPGLGASALRDCERIVFSSLSQIEAVAAGLAARSDRSMTGDAGVHLVRGT